MSGLLRLFGIPMTKGHSQNPQLMEKTDHEWISSTRLLLDEPWDSWVESRQWWSSNCSLFLLVSSARSS